MNDKNLPLDNSQHSLEELTDKADKILESLENEKDLSNSVESYQELLKLNKIIEKKFYKNFKNISEETKNKIKEIIKKKWKMRLTKLQETQIYLWKIFLINKAIPNWFQSWSTDCFLEEKKLDLKF